MYGYRETPWGMIRARQERDELGQRLRDLREVVLAAADDALAELGKPRGSKAKAVDILRALRLHVTKLGSTPS